MRQLLTLVFQIFLAQWTPFAVKVAYGASIDLNTAIKAGRMPAVLARIGIELAALDTLFNVLVSRHLMSHVLQLTHWPRKQLALRS
jgi:hypothetical protein